MRIPGVPSLPTVKLPGIRLLDLAKPKPQRKKLRIDGHAGDYSWRRRG